MEGAIICYNKFIPWTLQHINKLSRTEKVYLKKSAIFVLLQTGELSYTYIYELGQKPQL